MQSLYLVIGLTVRLRLPLRPYPIIIRMLHMMLTPAEERLRARVRDLMDLRALTQDDLAACLGMQQASASRMLSGRQRFRVEHFDRLATFLGVTVPELFFDAYGQWDRRTGLDRRNDEDRRRRKQPIYDKKVEIGTSVNRIAFEQPPE